MADYPREINIDDRTKDRLIRYIEDELTRHYAERGDYIRNLGIWQVDYWAEPSDAQATFPYRGAATLIIPLAAITVEAIHSRVMTTMFALSQFISAKPQSTKWQEHSRPVEKFLDHELLENVKIKRPINDSVLETLKFGTGIIKTGWERIERVGIRTVGDKEEEFQVIVKNNATMDCVPGARFLMPFVYQDPQLAAWCGEEHELTPYEIRLMESSGKFKSGTMDSLSAYFSTSPISEGNSGAEFRETQEKLENREAIWPSKLTVHELWLGFDIEGNEDLVVDGIIPREEIGNSFDKEIVVHYHRESRTFLSVRHNWYEDLHRPYDTGVYFPVEHRWAGIGICKQSEQFQKEITTQHRQRIDNATLANCRMIKVNNLTKYGPDEPIFPGKMWFVDNKDDIETFQLGEIYPSSFSNENQSLLYLQQRTGVNELNQGMPQAGTPGTATGDLARIQEGNKKHDYTYGNIKSLINAATKRTIMNIKQFGPRASVYYELVDHGELVKEFFTQDYNSIRDGLLLNFSVASQQDNKLLDRNNWQTVSQMIVGYYDNLIKFAQASNNPDLLARIVNHGMGAATEAMRQILESYDLKNIDRIIVQETLQNVAASTPPVGQVTAGGPTQPQPQQRMGGPAISPPQLAAPR